MKKISKNNLDEFLLYYNNFHDSFISSINYNIYESKIEMIVDVGWTRENEEKRNDAIDNNRIKIVFNLIKKCNIKEIFSWDYIQCAFVKYINLDDTEYICFSSDEKEPLFYIVCENIEYDEIL